MKPKHSTLTGWELVDIRPGVIDQVFLDFRNLIEENAAPPDDVHLLTADVTHGRPRQCHSTHQLQLWCGVRFGRPRHDGIGRPHQGRDKKESSKVGRQRFNPSHEHVKHGSNVQGANSPPLLTSRKREKSEIHQVHDGPSFNS